MKIWKKDYYEKLLQIKKKDQTVQELQREIDQRKARIAELQSKCTHSGYTVAFYSWHPGSMFPARICVNCNKCLGTAPEEEAEKLWAEHDSKAK